MAQRLMTILPDRGLIMLQGADSAKFLQGLITNDIVAAEPGDAVFAGLLTPKGKILSDFLIYVQDGENHWIDCARFQLAEIVKRLSMYKLRAKVEITDRSDQFSIAACWLDCPPDTLPAGSSVYADPRYKPLGHRLLLKRDGDGIPTYAGETISDQVYHNHRIGLTVPQGGLDYAYGEAFPHEACYDQLHGVDFKKGCYVGQEVVSRMHHKGMAKTRIVAIEAAQPLEGNEGQITADSKLIGQLTSTAGNQGIAMVRLDRADDALRQGLLLQVGNIPITLSRPPWATYDFFPEGSAT